MDKQSNYTVYAHLVVRLNRNLDIRLLLDISLWLAMI